MTRAPRNTTLVLLATALAACTAADVPGTRDEIAGTYTCDQDRTFSFKTTRGADFITVELGGQSHRLDQVPGLSGNTTFSDGTLTVWTRDDGRFATVEGTAEPYDNCEASEWESGGVIY